MEQWTVVLKDRILLEVMTDVRLSAFPRSAANTYAFPRNLMRRLRSQVCSSISLDSSLFFLHLDRTRRVCDDDNSQIVSLEGT